MNCRIGGLASRKNLYMFFLFNDALVFTRKNTEPAKVVKLWTCSVVKTSSRKFKVLNKGVIKVLNLECKSEVERDEWFDAVEGAASRAFKSSVQTWSNFASSRDLNAEGLNNRGSLVEEYQFVITPTQTDDEEEKSDETDLKLQES